MAFVFVHCVIGSNGDHKATRQNVAIQVTANDTIENNNVLLRVPKSDDNDYNNRCNDTVEKKTKAIICCATSQNSDTHFAEAETRYILFVCFLIVSTQQRCTTILGQ